MTATHTTTASELRAIAARPTAQPVRAGFFDAQGFELIQRVSKAFASSSLVPTQYQGNVANCMIAINMAERIGADPMMVMQNLYIVHGRPGWSAQFLIATFNHCGRFSALRYEWVGDKGKDSWGCRAWAIEKETGERIEGPVVTIDLAKKEAWFEKKGSKWQTIPQLMLMYRAAAWMIRAYAPEIAMGLQTAEELGDVIDVTPAENGTFEATLESLRGDAPSNKGQEPLGTPQSFTFAQVSDAINLATTLEDLDFARSMIEGVADEGQRDELRELITMRAEQIK
ncbi:MAG: hypothetical protein LBE75_01980 [Burkholderiales bacterium]|nr:hypothetical protein [Burkholderiales bacterium]